MVVSFKTNQRNSNPKRAETVHCCNAYDILRNIPKRQRRIDSFDFEEKVQPFPIQPSNRKQKYVQELHKEDFTSLVPFFQLILEYLSWRLLSGNLEQDHWEDDMYEKDEEKDDVQKIYSYLPPKAVLVLRIIELILFAFQLAIVGERPV